MRYCGVCATIGYCTPVSGFSQKVGEICPLPERVSSRLFATSFWLNPSSSRAAAVGDDTQLGLVEGLLDAQVHEPRHVAQLLQHLVREIPILRARADDLDVDGRRQAEVEDLADDVGRQERERRARELLRQHFAQRLDVVSGRPVILVQRDQHVRIAVADGAGVAVRDVDARHRQADVVDDARELVRRNHLADRRFDVIDLRSAVFHAHAGRHAHVQLDLARIDIREEVTTQQRVEQHRQRHHAAGR